jgi:hypothetical protein
MLSFTVSVNLTQYLTYSQISVLLEMPVLFFTNSMSLVY